MIDIHLFNDQHFDFIIRFYYQIGKQIVDSVNCKQQHSRNSKNKLLVKSNVCGNFRSYPLDGVTSLLLVTFLADSIYHSKYNNFK